MDAAARTKRDRFVDVATRRMKRLLRDFRLLGNCANRSAYEYSDADVNKVMAAIELETQALRARFQRGSSKEVDFKL